MKKEKFLCRFNGLELYEGETGVEVYQKKELIQTIAFGEEGPNKLNKGIEDAKEWIVQNAGKVTKETVATETALVETSTEVVEDPPYTKCRVCGCTQDNCEQCIKKTGKPCTWVEKDLCSACVEEPKIEVKDTRASQGTEEVVPQTEENYSAKPEEIIPMPEGDSFFFQQLATFGEIDLTMRIMKVNGQFTIGVKPGVKVRGMKQLNITGTPEEFDREFISVIMPQVKSTPGLMSTIADLNSGDKKSKDDDDASKERDTKKSAPVKPKKKTPKPAKPKVEKKPKPQKAKNEKKPAVKKDKPPKVEKKVVEKKQQPAPAEEHKPAVIEPSLFSESI